MLSVFFLFRALYTINHLMLLDPISHRELIYHCGIIWRWWKTIAGEIFIVLQVESFFDSHFSYVSGVGKICVATLDVRNKCVMQIIFKWFILRLCWQLLWLFFSQYISAKIYRFIDHLWVEVHVTNCDIIFNDFHLIFRSATLERWSSSAFSRRQITSIVEAANFPEEKFGDCF